MRQTRATQAQQTTRAEAAAPMVAHTAPEVEDEPVTTGGRRRNRQLVSATARTTPVSQPKAAIMQSAATAHPTATATAAQPSTEQQQDCAVVRPPVGRSTRHAAKAAEQPRVVQKSETERGIASPSVALLVDHQPPALGAMNQTVSVSDSSTAVARERGARAQVVGPAATDPKHQMDQGADAELPPQRVRSAKRLAQFMPIGIAVLDNESDGAVLVSRSKSSRDEPNENAAANILSSAFSDKSRGLSAKLDRPTSTVAAAMSETQSSQSPKSSPSAVTPRERLASFRPSSVPRQPLTSLPVSRLGTPNGTPPGKTELLRSSMRASLLHQATANRQILQASRRSVASQDSPRSPVERRAAAVAAQDAFSFLQDDSDSNEEVQHSQSPRSTPRRSLGRVAGASPRPSAATTQHSADRSSSGRRYGTGQKDKSKSHSHKTAANPAREAYFEQMRIELAAAEDFSLEMEVVKPTFSAQFR
ncbi:hypothetical protein CAOG_04301 [Capsaspora owczarzaki ATCC 30864]|uniref:Uncharacterized protein n=1 Tax=Capsaspora owczarzaki (strain ATCC 30864) TaxID=595528 RepID=A0A0D2WQZ8_CAPO3|nr:hypothetical protein CAOG_04301 [Capsaspora owczarzaki ATCC 30864]KJE93528.1 hypothetical protein CAOG_004301 [Capsaspora owczarzaki ATCC 30864]|eukprot:XP_004348129.1 hypothetical protein CAOG_04301 [Capsaspora owczarzaki ATCC 30864]